LYWSSVTFSIRIDDLAIQFFLDGDVGHGRQDEA